eukprot:2957893-Rhodomonas_salina.2
MTTMLVIITTTTTTTTTITTITTITTSNHDRRLLRLTLTVTEEHNCRCADGSVGWNRGGG